MTNGKLRLAVESLYLEWEFDEVMGPDTSLPGVRSIRAHIDGRIITCTQVEWHVNGNSKKPTMLIINKDVVMMYEWHGGNVGVFDSKGENRRPVIFANQERYNCSGFYVLPDDVELQLKSNDFRDHML